MDIKKLTIDRLVKVLQPFALHDLEDVCERLYLDHGDNAQMLHPASILAAAKDACETPLGGEDGFGDLSWRIGPDRQGLPFVRVEMAHDNEPMVFSTCIPISAASIEHDLFEHGQGEGENMVRDYVGEQLDEEDRADVYRHMAEDANECVRCLLGANRISSQADLDGLLRSAIQVADAEAVEDALSLGAPVNATDAQGNTPLHLAARGGHASLITPLIHSGAWVDEVNEEGQSPLHLAARAGSAQTCLILLAFAADAAKKDRQGRTPIDLGRGPEAAHEQSL